MQLITVSGTVRHIMGYNALTRVSQCAVQWTRDSLLILIGRHHSSVQSTAMSCSETHIRLALLHIGVSCTRWEKIQRRRKHKTDQRPVDGRAIMPTALLASFYFQKYSSKIVIMMKNPYLFKSWHFYLHRPPSTHGEDPFYAFSNCLKLQV